MSVIGQFEAGKLLEAAILCADPKLAFGRIVSAHASQ
jgi:hypothetical protein